MPARAIPQGGSAQPLEESTMTDPDVHPTLDCDSGFEADDQRIAQALDAESYNRKSLYNFFGFKPPRPELSHAPVTISGRLPDDLTGVYLRNGTNPQFGPSSARWHMFDGP